MDNEYDIKGLISEIIREETVFLRHYIGEVVDNSDLLNKGRVLVTIAELGFDEPSAGMWCYPRQGNSISIPEVGSFVEVYFMGGDPNRPVYLHYASEMVEMLPTQFTSSSIRVIFESPVTNESIKYNDEDSNLTFLEGTEAYVLGDTLKTEIQKNTDAITQLQTDLTNWVPVPNDGGLALKNLTSVGFELSPVANLASILSEVIKGK
jgi:hypothetical protein